MSDSADDLSKSEDSANNIESPNFNDTYNAWRKLISVILMGFYFVLTLVVYKKYIFTLFTFRFTLFWCSGLCLYLLI